MNRNKNKINSYKSEKAKPDIDFLINLELYTGISIRSLWRKKIDAALVPKQPLSFEDSPAIPYNVPNAKPLVVEDLRDEYKNLHHPSLDGLENHELRIRELEKKNRELELKLEALNDKPL